ncbi:hypothetical protein D0860_05448 [Hortaea werneckii]|uniref:Uncharacterized protein n=1 Tax=Hortaea werneckii TaxID=91943 RepID=A0A3M7H053_HORWE|nr:hypothetical protein D0860_05448 [Hortaea werneckii]
MAAALSPLTDILPPEVRIRTYKEVLRADRPLRIARKKYPEEVRFDTSLLFVGKSVFLEASDVLFEVNTIHLRRPSELNRAFKVDKRGRRDLRVLQNVRYLCLVDDLRGRTDLAYGRWITKKAVSTHIKKCLALPKLKECTIIYDRMPWPEEEFKFYFSPTTGLRSIVEYLRSANLGHELLPEYTDVGVAALQRSQSPTIKFVDRWLKTAWAQVKEGGHINVGDVYIRSSAARICRNPQEFYDIWAGPPVWCALYDYCTQARNDEDCQAMRDLREGMQRRLTKIPMSSGHGKLPQDLPLRDVSPEVVAPDVIEWLSELLLHARSNSNAPTRLRRLLWY